MPVMVSTPIRVSPVESVSTVVSVAPPEVAISWANKNANRWRREEDWSRQRARWRRIVVVGRGGAVRLDHLSARVRLDSGCKTERRYHQCYYNKFLSHDQMSLLLFGRLNPMITAKLPKNSEVYSARSKLRSTASLLSFRTDAGHREADRVQVRGKQACLFLRELDKRRTHPGPLRIVSIDRNRLL